MAVAETIPRPSGREALRDIPGNAGLPLVGHSLSLIRDPFAVREQHLREYGLVSKVRGFGRWVVLLQGADALQMVLMDRDRNFSSHHGWFLLNRIFANGLLTRDFDDHRGHRRIMQAAFKPAPMADYVGRMNAQIAVEVDKWPVGSAFPFYVAIKRLTLDLAASVFLGLAMGAEAQKVNRAFVDELKGVLALVRTPLPGNRMWRGFRGRAFMLKFFRRLVAERRGSAGTDMVSHLCNARSEEGEFFSDEEIADHLNLLLMAAHDTTTSALTTMMWALARHPRWQDVLHEEAQEIGGDGVGYDEMDRAEQIERVFKEALRLRPPVPFIPRYALEPFEFGGRAIPGGTQISVSPGMVARDPGIWTEPMAFDPDRFSPERAEDQRHRFAWAPFGGGAHKCIGLHFSTMQVKSFVASFLRRYRVDLAGDRDPDWVPLPIPKPKNDLPVVLTRR